MRMIAPNLRTKGRDELYGRQIKILISGDPDLLRPLHHYSNRALGRGQHRTPLRPVVPNITSFQSFSLLMPHKMLNRVPGGYIFVCKFCYSNRAAQENRTIMPIQQCFHLPHNIISSSLLQSCIVSMFSKRLNSVLGVLFFV